MRRLHGHLLAAVTATLDIHINIQPVNALFRHIVNDTVNMTATVIHQVSLAGVIAARDMKDQSDIPDLAGHDRYEADITFLESLYIHVRTISEIVHTYLRVFEVDERIAAQTEASLLPTTRDERGR